MIRAIAQAILSAAGVVAAHFLSPDEPDFPLIQLSISLVWLMVSALVIWWVTRSWD